MSPSPAGTGRGARGEPRVVPIRDEGIRLGQFLKLADLVDTGAEVKPLVTTGAVLVNGDVETRRGRQLARGDVVSVRTGPQTQSARVG